MALTKKIEEVFNSQLQREFYSSYLYLAMAGYFESINLKGFANWMLAQAEEERGHAMKFYDFIISRGGRVNLEAIEKPPVDWNSPLAAFESTLEHEQKVTGHINDLVNVSLETKDHAAHSFLKFFIDEQVEEEDTVNDLIGKLKLVKDAPGGLFLLDNELAQRPMPGPGTTPAE